MQPLFQFEQFAVYEPIDDSELLELPNAAFTYYIQFNHALFQSVIWRERMIVIVSQTELQISPPSIPYKRCLLEVIGKLQNDPANVLDFELTQDEIACITALPTGGKLSDLYNMTGYRSEPLPEINYDMFRLCWYLGAPELQSADQLMQVHPSLDRPLTGLEWSAIDAASSDDRLGQWLGSLASGCHPSPASGTPVFERTEVLQTVLDWRPISTYPALRIFDYPEPRKPMRIFNVDSNGNVIVPWHLISNRKHGTLTYEQATGEIAEDSEQLEIV